MPNLDEMKDKADQAAENMKQDHTDEAADTEQQPQQDKSGNMMDQVKKKMDSDQDGDFDMDDVKKMSGDAVGKVKGLFKKD